MDNDPDLEQEDALERMREVLPTLKRWKDQPKAKKRMA
jgi:hypothetical protein